MKKYLSILLLIVFIVPSVVSASWWNPFSWWSGNKDNLAEIADVSVPEDFSESRVGGVANKEEPIEIKKEIIVEKITDPALQSLVTQLTSQVQNLIKENELLRNELRGLRVNNQNSEKYSEVPVEVSKEGEWCSDARTSFRYTKEEIEKLEESKLDIFNSFETCGTWCNSELSKIDENIALLEGRKADIEEDITYYCE